MRIFFAGASGAIGRRLLPMLLEAGHEVTAMTSSSERAEELGAAGAEPVVCDAHDRDGLRGALAGARPAVVINQLTRIPDPIDPRRMEEQFAENDRLRSEGTRNLVEAAVAAGARRVVSQSVAFAYPHGGDGPKTEDDPLWLDAARPFRRSVEALRDLEESTVRTEGIEGVVLRYGYFYGPGTAYSPDGSMAAAVRARAMPLVGGGRGEFSFVHVDDAARATLAALTAPPGIYNVVDDEPAPVREWLPAFCDAVGARAPRRVPGLLARLATNRYAVSLMTKQRGASNARARERLGFAPRFASWREGFREGLA